MIPSHKSRYGPAVTEFASLAPGGSSFGTGLLGATSPTAEGLEQARLLEIERRILAIEERLKEQGQ